MKFGVPQGSNLGPFLFNLYTQELTSVVNEECNHTTGNTNMSHNDDLFDNECDDCGVMITFADDASLLLRTRRGDCQVTSNKLDSLLIKLKLFLRSNNLMLNIDKTQLLRVTPRQQLVANQGENILLEARDKDDKRIAPKTSAKILGLTVSNNLLWGNHLEKGKEAIIPKCKKMLGALKYAAGGSSFSVKKRLAEAIIMSRIVYGIQLWGSGSAKTVIRRVQSVQNLVMCWVTSSHRLTSTKTLLGKLNWLSVNQLIFYHGFLLQYKVMRNKAPKMNFKQLNIGAEKMGRMDLTKNRWSNNIQMVYNSVSPDIRNELKISVFKKRIKSWIRVNIDVFGTTD